MTWLRLTRCVALLLLAGCLDDRPFGSTGPGDDGVAVTPRTLFLEPGGTARLFGQAGSRGGGGVVWESSDPTVVTVNAEGIVTAIMPGSAEVRGENARGSGRTRVTVVAAAASLRAWQLAQRAPSDVSLLGVWSADSLTSFVVGQAGTVLRTVDGGLTWVRMTFPDSGVDLVGVWGSSPSDVFAVGTQGNIFRFNGQSWSRMNSPTGNTLLEVWGLAPDDVYAVGSGVSLRYDGTTWRALSGTEAAELWAVWGTDRSNIFAAGQNGVLFRLEGTHWMPMQSPTNLLLLGLWGTDPSNVYAIGIQGTLVQYDGTRWRLVPLPTRIDLFAIWGTGAGSVLAVGNNGAVVLFNGSAWTLVPQTASAEHLRAVHAAPSGGFVVAGWSGTTLHRESNGWRLGTSGPALFDVAEGPGGIRYAVGNAGAVFAGSGSTWSRLPGPSRQTLYGAAHQQGRLVVVGDSGTILRYDGAHWQDESILARRLLRSIWTHPSGAAFIVGEEGTVVRHNGTGWTSSPPVTTRFLRHVFGFDPTHVYAVGDSGTTLFWDGGEWNDMGLRSNALLRAVWGTAPDDLFAVGSGGAIFRYDGVRWYAMQSPTQLELRTVWGFSPTEVYAAGEEGILLRFNGSTWSVQSNQNFRSLILALEPGPDGRLLAVGARAMILRGER
jgi:Big-like domain-containing protein